MYCERILVDTASGMAVVPTRPSARKKMVQGRAYEMQRLAGTILDALTTRDDNERMQVLAKADKIVVASLACSTR